MRVTIKSSDDYISRRRIKMTLLKSDYVFCVDSDGCAMDTMTYKHQLFFGPIAADEFEISDRETFLKEWDKVNLFSRTRGVNRFVALLMLLEFANVDNIDNLKSWVETTSSLSNASLEAEIAKNPATDLKKALVWSNEVNRQIKSYDGDVLAFEGAKEGLIHLHELGKLFIVSSANKEAVVEEWEDQELMPYIDDLYCQDRGKKEDVIAMLIAEGYDPCKIMMIGDSPGDLHAAEMNNVKFYPILVGKEKESWLTLKSEVADKFINDQLTEQDFENYATTFWDNLDKER